MMHRRRFLAGIGVAAGAAGCLGDAGDADPNVVLPEPDRRFESADVPYPAWGQRVPDVTLDAPLAGRRIAVRDIETPSLLTFFYSNCRTVCPVLVGTLRNVQVHAIREGYGDEVAFLPITFDPGRDDAAALRSYADRVNVDLEAGNWHFLRPDGPGAVDRVVRERFGVTVSRRAGMDGGTGNASLAAPDDAADGNRSGTPSGASEEHANASAADGGYMFVHTALTILANADGYVERAYRTKSPDQERIVEDLRRVREAR